MTECARCGAWPRDCRCPTRPSTPLERAAERAAEPADVFHVEQRALNARERYRKMEGARAARREAQARGDERRVAVVADVLRLLVLQARLGDIVDGLPGMLAVLGENWPHLTGTERARALRRSGLDEARRLIAVGALAARRGADGADQVAAAVMNSVMDAALMPPWVVGEVRRVG